MTGTPSCGTGGAGFPRRRFPCDVCPIRADNGTNPASQFPAFKWAELTKTVVNPVTGYGPSYDAPMFGCHKGEPGSNADLACAGWLVQFGGGHPRVRMALDLGRLPESALVAGDNWPPLHPTWRDVIRNQTSPPPPGDTADMTVTVRDAEAETRSWGSGPARIITREVTISAYCPVCGGPRGTPVGHNFHSDGEWSWVQRWTNPCGHRDTYETVLREAALLARTRHPSACTAPATDTDDGSLTMQPSDGADTRTSEVEGRR